MVLELASSWLLSWLGVPHPQNCIHTWGLFMTNLLIKATSKPAPTGSMIVGITYAAENHYVLFSLSVRFWLKGLKG